MDAHRLPFHAAGGSDRVAIWLVADWAVLMRREAEISGLAVTAFASLDDCASYVIDEMRSERGGVAFAINAEKVVSFGEDPALRQLLQNATLRYPDGAGVVIAMRRHGVCTARVPGVDLWLAILRNAAHSKTTIALIGAQKTVLEGVRDKLSEEFPNVRVVFAADGFDGARDVRSLQVALAESRPELVFVAMGTPRQEKLIADLRRHYPEGYYLGLGGSFDVYCGLKKRAPMWMQHLGLEWLYRFLTEPSRAGRERKRLRFLKMLILGRI